MIYVLKPVPIPDSFRWIGNKFHLTYAGFLTIQDVLAAVGRATTTQLLGWSIVHEDTAEYNDEGHQITEGFQRHIRTLPRRDATCGGR